MFDMCLFLESNFAFFLHGFAFESVAFLLPAFQANLDVSSDGVVRGSGSSSNMDFHVLFYCSYTHVGGGAI